MSGIADPFNGHIDAFRIAHDHARVRVYNPDAFTPELVKEAAIFILDGPKGTQADREIAQRLTGS